MMCNMSICHAHRERERRKTKRQLEGCSEEEEETGKTEQIEEMWR